MAKKKRPTTPELLLALDDAIAREIEKKAAGPKRPPPQSIRNLKFASGN